MQWRCDLRHVNLHFYHCYQTLARLDDNYDNESKRAAHKKKHVKYTSTERAEEKIQIAIDSNGKRVRDLCHFRKITPFAICHKID